MFSPHSGFPVSIGDLYYVDLYCISCGLLNLYWYICIHVWVCVCTSVSVYLYSMDCASVFACGQVPRTVCVVDLRQIHILGQFKYLYICIACDVFLFLLYYNAWPTLSRSSASGLNCSAVLYQL